MERTLAQETFELRCPGCHAGVDWQSGECKQCGEQYRDRNGYLSFANRAEAAAEMAFYDEYYRSLEAQTRLQNKKTVENAAVLWNNPWNSHSEIIWDRMSGIGNKRVLLIGNGESEKELAFLKLKPTVLVYSDLSSAAVKIMFERYDLSPYGETIRGAAIDALSLPCHDASIDVVYGFAMVHHLPDVPRFLSEVHRVLVPGGQCVFLDDARAPIWQLAKLTLLRPLMRWSHRTSGISPEDLRFTMAGGFRTEELARIIRGLNADPWFERSGFFSYLWRRGAEKLFPERVSQILMAPMLGHLMAGMDRLFKPLLRANCIRLAWGFRKP